MEFSENSHLDFFLQNVVLLGWRKIPYREGNIVLCLKIRPNAPAWKSNIAFEDFFKKWWSWLPHNIGGSLNGDAKFYFLPMIFFLPNQNQGWRCSSSSKLPKNADLMHLLHLKCEQIKREISDQCTDFISQIKKNCRSQIKNIKS